MSEIFKKIEMPSNGTAYKFEGRQYDHTNVSFILVNVLPGKGTELHTHPYEEVFVIEKGMATFTIGEEIVEASEGEIVIVPPNVPHKYFNSGTEVFRKISLHPRESISTEWL